MSVKDVIKNSVFESIGVGNGLTIRTVLLILIMACLAGIYIFMVYKLSAKSAFYSKDLIVAAIMIAMQSNLLVSLGMVGALSIVRFRNAVKNPVDLLYLFWSISTGIIVGVGLHILGIILCVIMTILLFMLNMIPNVKAPELLVLRSIEKEMNYEELYEIIRGNCKYFKEKARTVKNGESEIIIEISTKSKEKLLRELNDMGQLTQINCLSHDGECRI